MVGVPSMVDGRAHNWKERFTAGNLAKPVL
jgi:hypothetical protein